MEKTNVDIERAKHAVRELLFAIGENPDRDGLLETPQRVANMYQELFAGLHQDPLSVSKLFYEPGNHNLVIVKDIPFYSMCEHHLLPFMGVAHIAYLPNENGAILGLSKIARIVDVLAKKPQLQERLTQEIAQTILTSATPKGVLAVLEAEHLCMTMRGIRKPGAKTVTLCSLGVFETDEQQRTEALRFLNKE